jgi:threonine/homoserine/homoserine lactone efflux protein
LLTTLAPLLLFAFITAVTPGPNNILLMAAGANYGVRNSLPLFAGIVLGFPVMVWLVAFGLSSGLQGTGLVDWVQWLGLAYIAYLAWLLATAPVSQLEQDKPAPIGFTKAALLQWINGKSWMMVTGAVAVYGSVDAVPWQQALLFAGVFLATAIPTGLLWLVFGRLLKRYLQQPKRQKAFNLSMAALLVLSIVPAVL